MIVLGAVAGRLARGAAGIVAAFPGWAKGALVAAGVMYLIYEGVGPWKPLPFWEIGFPGRMDRAVETQRAICETDKARSAKQSREDDQERQRERIESMAGQLRQANERTLAAQGELDEYAEARLGDDADEVAAARPAFNCRPGPRASRSLQRRELPYPGARPPGD